MTVDSEPWTPSIGAPSEPGGSVLDCMRRRLGGKGLVTRKKKSRCRRQGRAQETPRSGLVRRRRRRRPTSSSCANDPSMLGLVMPPHLHTDTRRHLVRRVFGAELVMPHLDMIPLLLMPQWVVLGLMDLDLVCYHRVALGRTAAEREAFDSRALSLFRRFIRKEGIIRIGNTRALVDMDERTLIAVFFATGFLHLDCLNLLAC